MAIRRILIPIIGFGKGGGYRVLSQLASYWHRAGCQLDSSFTRLSQSHIFPPQAAFCGSAATAP